MSSSQIDISYFPTNHLPSLSIEDREMGKLKIDAAGKRYRRRRTSRDSKLIDHYAFERNPHSAFYRKSTEPRNRISTKSSSLPETAASVAVAATVVGAAATLLIRRTKASEETEVPLKICEDCGGSGICSECNGEGFVLRKLSDESAERARMNAKSMATRYTAGLPKKWSYCTKCSSSRSCMLCGGRGKLSY